MADNSPRMLAGRYQLGDLIGRGGMAEVHIGRDTRLGRTVAIKVLRTDLARDPTFQARFRREAQSAAGLNHPSIVAVYDTGEDVSTDPATGEQLHLPFIVMEYVEGHTVRELVRDGAALPIDEAVEITMGVLSALQYAHQAGIVHRDIKPANVMITTTGQVKVMDFGIARALADSAATMTQTQAVIGTAQYLSPEQARGETVDTRSDLYSAGCLLYELLSGRTPFVGDSAVAVAYQHVREEAAPPSAYAPDVPEVLDRITLKALAKERDQRYQSAAEFRADLEAAMSGGQVMAPAVGMMNAETQLMQPTAETQVLGASAATAATAAMPAGVAAAAGGATTATQMFGEPLEGDDDEGMSTKRKVMIGALIALGVLAIALIAWAFLKPDEAPPPPTSSAPTTVIVPAVEQGWKAEDAENALKSLNLVPLQASEPSATVPEGEVTRFDPQSGQTVAVRSSVTYYTSTGPDQVTVPSYTGWQLADVKTQLPKDKLKLGAINQKASTEEPGTVLSTDPKSGTKVKVDTEVNVTVSTGKVGVPNLFGMTQDKALEEISKAGLSAAPPVEEDANDASIKAGTVFKQSPSAGSKVDAGTEVAITVAKDVTIVPNTYGSSASTAKAALKSARLKAGSTTTLKDAGQCDPATTPADGKVCLSVPAPGDRVSPQTTVDLYVYQAPPPPTVDPTPDPTVDPTPDPTPDPTDNTGNDNGNDNEGGVGNAGGVGNDGADGAADGVVTQ